MNKMTDFTVYSQGTVQKNSILQKTYALLALSFLPCIGGVFFATQVNVFQHFTSYWTLVIAFFAFFYIMVFLISKFRYSNVGIALLMLFTFGMGIMLTPLLGMALSYSNGAKLVGLAALMTAAVFFTMAAIAKTTKINMNSLGRFLTIGVVVLMVGVVVNLFLQLPVLMLALSAVFVVFSSLVIMWQVRTIIDGGEDSYISAALTIFISIYNIFSSLLRILLAFAGED